MSARIFWIVGLVLITVGTAGEVAAELICGAINSIARDVKRRQCWPDPFNAPDRAAVRAPFVIQVANGWQRQNMLGEFHFKSNSEQLNEAGQIKVRWILTASPQQHRFIYVHTANTGEATAARMASVQQFASQITPDNMPPIMATSMSDDGWPADQVDLINRKFLQENRAIQLDLPSRGGWVPDNSGSSGN